MLNYLYAILESEMTIALLARGLDPGIGMFHTNIDGRSSLVLDAIEAVRPYVEYWLFAYLQTTVFANRDFHELPDGEVRLSHPLNAHLAHTAALWRKACQPVAEWLARSFERTSDFSPVHAAILPIAVSPSRSELQSQALRPALTPPLTGFITATGGHRLSGSSALRQRAGRREGSLCQQCAGSAGALLLRIAARFAAMIALTITVGQWGSAVLPLRLLQHTNVSDGQ